MFDAEDGRQVVVIAAGGALAFMLVIALSNLGVTGAVSNLSARARGLLPAG